MIKRTTGTILVSCKWIYRVNDGIKGVEVKIFKARVVYRSLTLEEGIQFNNVFPFVVKHISIGILISIVEIFYLELKQMDVKTTFLYGNLAETILMKQLKGYDVKGKEDYVYKLNTSIYGLNPSPRQWNKRFNKFIAHIDFQRSKFDHRVYLKFLHRNYLVILLLYVDDILMARHQGKEIKRVKIELNKEFE